MNVLVYSGPGTTAESVKCCADTLRQLLSPNYAVLNVGATEICNEPWQSSTSLLAMPGGADLPYCDALNGKGNKAIEQFVRKGGRYIGFCAGGYYGSGQVEFETGTTLEVFGKRELKFFPGVCRGSAFPGFEYGKGTGVIATRLGLNLELGAGETLKTYFNGGGCFVDAKKYKDVTVLAEYLDPIAVDGGDGNAAAVFCKVGKGNAVLMGVHPEFSLNPVKNSGTYPENDVRFKVLNELVENEEDRIKFMGAVFRRMGLKVNDGGVQIPKISRLNLSSSSPEKLGFLVEKVTKGGLDEKNQLVCSNDTFEFHDAADVKFTHKDDVTSQTDEIEDNHKIVKMIDVFYSGLPNARYTPYFNHELYYHSLQESQLRVQRGEIGSTLLYGEVVTSTSTMLDKNFQLLANLPHGFTAVGTIQANGRGRGKNVWVNPTGALATSVVLRIPVTADAQVPIVFIQYLVALAMVEAIKAYGPGFEDMPVKLKWPNDIYAEIDEAGQPKLLKIGGIIVNTNYIDGHYVIVFGLGLNVSNLAPSTSLNQILANLNAQRVKNGFKALTDQYKLEVLLGKFLAQFERMYSTFLYTGFGEFEELYYKRWLHTGQLVTLEQYDNVKARIKGISTDAGLLVVHATDREGRESGAKFELQPDGNSFDMLRGLLKKKE